MLKRFRSALLLSLLLAFALSGCGGGGSPAPVTPTGSRQVDVFVTDAFSDDYAQVWVTLFKIEAGQNGAFTTVYDAAEGKTINVAALKASTQFLSSVTLPDVAYDSLRITFGDTTSFGSTIPEGMSRFTKRIRSARSIRVISLRSVRKLNVDAMPFAPARPVRPARWMKSSGT